MAALAASLAACHGPPAPERVAATAPLPEGGAGAGPLAAIRRAEDLRRARDVPAAAQGDPDPAVRRAAARAFARILDADDRPLLRALEDEDPETVAWGAYGLGEACARPDEHVRALAARGASLEASPPIGGPAALDPLGAIVRAVGRCGGDAAEPTLRAWLRAGGPPAEAASYALGDIAARAGSLSLESSNALLGASLATPPLAPALYAFGRGEGTPPEEIAPRLFAAAHAALDRPGPERVFAVRALGRADAPGAVDDLARVLASKDFSPSERVEAARALGKLRKGGQAALADALAAFVGDGGRQLAKGLEGDRFVVVLTAAQSLGDEGATRANAALWSLARLPVEPDAPPAVSRRAGALRCAAAEKLARGAWDSDVLRTCDPGDGEAGERARLASLLRAPLAGPRRAAWAQLAQSAHVRVREAALSAIGGHAELGDAARAAIAQALGEDKNEGVVATAATVVHAHPELFAARDPDPAVAGALEKALARPLSPDLVETRAALVDAAVALGLPAGRAAATAACRDPNATVRARAAAALVAAGTAHPDCPAPEGGEPAPELAQPLAGEKRGEVRVALDTEAGPLALRFDPTFAPIAVARLVALARSGFYTGGVVHRVAPGFVVQFGDKGADGYGGAGALLRCETAPVPFEPLGVGVALAGRDTGSSQIFVTLARTPRLDGAYAWVGRAEGDWSAVAEGDVIRGVRVEDADVAPASPRDP